MNTITIETIEKLRQALKAKELEPIKKNNLSKGEAIRMLANEIQKLQKRGYAISQIAEIFRNHGVEIKDGTLRSYIQRNSKKQKIRKMQNGKLADEAHQENRNESNATFS